MSLFRTAVVASVVVAALGSGRAHANCARAVQDITPRVQQIKDPKVQERAQDYLQRARRELDENDEFECQSAIDAIEKMLKQAQDKK